MPIILQCVNDGGRIRVRVMAYVDSEGEVHKGVYNDGYNCRFPRNLRVVGRSFRVQDKDVKLISGIKAPFYSVSTGNLEVLDSSTDDVYIYEACEECAVCMSNPPSIAFFPCGHFCTCEECASRLRECCLCRSPITGTAAVKRNLTRRPSSP
jgi:hypothetical protein